MRTRCWQTRQIGLAVLGGIMLLAAMPMSAKATTYDEALAASQDDKYLKAGDGTQTNWSLTVEFPEPLLWTQAAPKYVWIHFRASPPSTNFTVQFFNGDIAVSDPQWSSFWSESGIFGPFSWTNSHLQPVTRMRIWQRQPAAPGVVYIDAVTDGNYYGPGTIYAHYFTHIGPLVAAPDNMPPVANAGGTVTIESDDQALTILQGSASDADGDALRYQWLEGGTVLQGWTAVGANGEAPLNLGDLPTFTLGSHTLTLEVTDDKVTTPASSQMTLTLLNTPPAVSVNPASQAVEIGVDGILITGTVADFDADSLTYEWTKDGVVLESGTVSPTTEGPYEGLDVAVSAGDPRFPLGTHTVTLQVSDGTNVKTVTAEVIVQDSLLPTLSPTPSVGMLWPPDHTLRPVTITADASDGNGGAITLSATVTCNEEPATSEPDWYIDGIDNATGTISLRLRATRLGKDEGRVYTITVTATDGGGNQSSSAVTVGVPHDRRKK